MKRDWRVRVTEIAPDGTPKRVRLVRSSATALASIDEWMLEGLSRRERKSWLERRRDRQSSWAVQDGLRDLLKRYEWEWFGHLTFETCRSLDFARASVSRWANKVSRRAWGTNYTRRPGQGLFGFSAFERQKRGDWHAHVLLAGTREFDRFEAMHLWEKQHGFARIFPYDAKRGGVAYATKYVTKEIDGDWSLVGHWRRVEDLPLLQPPA